MDKVAKHRRQSIELGRFLVGLYAFLLALDGFKVGWRYLFGVDQASALILGNINALLANPFVGLLIGVLVTSLIQSSSATIAIIISFVAVQNGPIELCIPIILGANIGTTVTNTLVVLGHSLNRDQFDRAMPAALVDDVYKVCNIGMFFLLELTFGLLTRISQWTLNALDQFTISKGSTGFLPDFIDWLTAPVLIIIDGQLGHFSPYLSAMIMGGLAFLLLLLGLRLMGDAMQALFLGRVEKMIRNVLSRPWRGAVLGLAACWILQSSSVTTSLMMPFVAHNLATLRNAYYFAVGASIGTTIDAGQIIAYMKYGVVGVATGIVHIFVNVVGAILFLSIPKLQDVPIRTAEYLGRTLQSNRWAPLMFGALVFTTFYLIPVLLIWLLI